MTSLPPSVGVGRPDADPPAPSWWTFALVYLPVACLPLVVWTVGALRAGPLSPAGLGLGAGVTLVVGAAMAWLYAERRRAETIRTDLDRLVRTDPLTGLSNRRALFESLDVWGRRAGRLDLPLTLLLVDLDDFKHVNDVFGHAAGDAVLRSFSATLRESTRVDQDILFRLGGDEFVVLMIGTDAHAAQVVADRVAQRCGADCVLDDDAARVRCSIGMATRQPGESMEAWLHRADTAMYAAKPQRRGLMLVHGEGA
jgi:diguanylate cyclase